MLGAECRVTKDDPARFPKGRDGYNALWGHSLNTKEAFYTNDPSGHPAFKNCAPPGHVPIERFLSVPALFGDKVAGQIALANPSRDYNDRDLEIITRLAAIFAIAMDRKRMEEDLREFNRTLERRVKEETNKLMVQEQILIQQSKLAALGEMIGAIAHQWRQPLNAISMITQDLRDAYKYGEFNENYLFNSVDKTLEQVRHMSVTIEDFRNFFMPSKEKVHFKLNSAVKEVIHLTHDQMMKAHISVSLDCRYDAARKPGEGAHSKTCACEPELAVYGYPNEFKQALLNIMANARDAIVNKRRQDASAGARPPASKTVMLEIRDTGGGIPSGILAKLFEPYFTTKEGEGTGIGLYMSKVIIEKNMGGLIRASNGEKGAVFTIELPVEGGG
jgi:signal transduction histidine kinase